MRRGAFLEGLVFGLGALLATASAIAPARADELRLHFIRSPLGIRWKTPQSLAASTVANTAAAMLGARHSIGHAQTELFCDGGDGLAPFHIATGQTSEPNSPEKRLILKEKIGLSVLFYDFIGVFEKGRVSEDDIRESYRRNTAHYVTLDISPSTCRRIQQYITEYDERGVWRHYSTGFRPRHGEGAGCTSYAASLVDVAGLMLPEFKTGWSRYRRIPRRFMGGWLNPGRKVDIFALSVRPGTRWAQAGEPHLALHFWDPDMMYAWVERAWGEYRDGRLELGGYPVSLERRGRAYGIRVDMRSVATPTEPLWLQEGASQEPVTDEQIDSAISIEPADPELDPADLDLGSSLSVQEFSQILRQRAFE